jgi:hypothetical protein
MDGLQRQIYTAAGLIALRVSITALAPKRGDIPRNPTRQKPRPAIRVQYGVLPYRFTQAAVLEIGNRHDSPVATLDHSEGS